MTDEFDPQLKQLLDDLKPVPPRNLQRAARGRARFLAESAQPISGNPFLRLIHRTNIRPHIFKKERFSMNTLLVIALFFTALFGGAAGTAYAAQDALPSEALYPVKTVTEDVRLALSSDPQAKFELALQFSAQRAEEIEAMLAAGSVVPEPAVTRFESQQQQALQFAADLPDDLALPALERVQEQARQQEQAMQQLELTDPVCEQIRARVQTMLQTQAQTAQTGITDPDMLRDQLRLRDRIHLATPTAEPVETEDVAITGSNPWTTGTPTPGSSYGPGESQNPWTDETPVPGSGYGPGEKPAATPSQGGGYGPGPNPTQSPENSGGQGGSKRP